MDMVSYPLGYQRQPSRTVKVGDLFLGSNFPIRVQSMLSSSTKDVTACFKEIQALDQAGCELIRLTVPSRKDLDAVPEIRRLMVEENVRRPLIADIHYSPQLALDACELFEKVRINPGNFSDRPRNSGSKPGTDFEEGYQKLKEAVAPLAFKLKKFECALRIGVNHGSLSSRMMERFGDSPLGMVMSALEMTDLFEEAGFDQLVVSLKSSNPLIVQRAYRLLIEKQAARNPVAVHLGVTEAGNDLMGRIKSLVGIGVLLGDGIGDTIRVSLTEPGPNEIKFARQLITAVKNAQDQYSTRDEPWKRPINHEQTPGRTFMLHGMTSGKGLQIGQFHEKPLPGCDVQFRPDFTYRLIQDQVFLGDESEPLPVLNREMMKKLVLPEDATRVLISSESPL